MDSYLVVDAARKAREVLSRVDNDVEPMAVVAASGTSGAVHLLQVLAGVHRELDCPLRRKLTGANSSGHASRPPPSFS